MGRKRRMGRGSSAKPRSGWTSLGTKTIDLMKYGTAKHKKINRVVYREKTLSPKMPIYWLQLVHGDWVNTTRKGIKDGIVVHKELRTIPINLGG